MLIAGYILLGLVTGILSGLIGIGGGVFILPALVFLFGLSQHEAQGTTLALLILPIGLLAAYGYYKAGYINVHIALFIALGFIIGGFIGAKYAVALSGHVLEKIFGIMMLAVGLFMIFKK